jgi:group I intron endonuclease
VKPLDPNSDVPGALYRGTNLLNGKRYWGISTNPRQRWINHKSRALKGETGCPKLFNSIRKYGFENFKFEVMAWYRNLYEAGQVEIALVAKGLGELNTNPGGQLGSLGHKMTPESSRKKSLATKGVKRPNAGPNISAGKKGRKFTPEHKAALSAAKKGKPSNRLGAVLSEETIAKMSKARTGKPTGPCSEERKKKISQSRQLGISRRKLVGLLVSLAVKKGTD